MVGRSRWAVPGRWTIGLATTTFGGTPTRHWRWHSWQNGSDQWLAASAATISCGAAASPFASRGSERPIQMERPSTPPREILPGQQGRTQSQPARRLRLRGRLTRATTDLNRQAPSAWAASGALTPLRPSRPLRAGLPSGPSPPNATPPPSLSQSRAELRPPDRGREDLACSRGGRERAERLPSADRSQQILNTAGRHRDSAARLCSAFCAFHRIPFSRGAPGIATHPSHLLRPAQMALRVPVPG